MNIKELIEELEKLRTEFGDDVDVIITLCEVFNGPDDYRNDYYHADDGISIVTYSYQKKAVELFSYITDWD